MFSPLNFSLFPDKKPKFGIEYMYIRSTKSSRHQKNESSGAMLSSSLLRILFRGQPTTKLKTKHFTPPIRPKSVKMT